jgi:hypothetical protein
VVRVDPHAPHADECTFAPLRITDLRLEPAGDAVRAAARVAWEESERPPVDLFFETDGSDAAGFRPDANAFLLACAFPAMRHRERRIAVDGAVCPRLRDGLDAAAGVLRGWYGPPRRLPAIEPAAGFVSPPPLAPPRSGMLFSGGVDSTALLRANRREFPRSDPLSIADLLWVAAADAPPEGEALLRGALSRIAAAAGARLLPVRSNLRRLDDDLEFFAREHLSAAFLSAAHLFAGRISRISVASTVPSARAVPWGSHPMLDPLYGSAALEVRHAMPDVPRLEKVREISGWAPALENLHSCNDEPSGGKLNCEICEKCVETALELFAAGAPGPWPTFPGGAPAASAIASLPVLQDVAGGWEELGAALAARGRADLAAAIGTKLRERAAARRWHQGTNWSGPLRRWDGRWTGGRMRKAWGTIRRAASRALR